MKQEVTEKLHALSSFASRARRAEFNTSVSGRTNMYGDNELVDSISSGAVNLSEIDKDELPEEMQALSAEEQEVLIQEKVGKRQELKKKIELASQQRNDYLKEEAQKAGGYKDSLDDKIYSAVREQAGKKGFVYEADAPAY